MARCFFLTFECVGDDDDGILQHEWVDVYAKICKALFDADEYDERARSSARDQRMAASDVGPDDLDATRCRSFCRSRARLHRHLDALRPTPTSTAPS